MVHVHARTDLITDFQRKAFFPVYKTTQQVIQIYKTKLHISDYIFTEI